MYVFVRVDTNSLWLVFYFAVQLIVYQVLITASSRELLSAPRKLIINAQHIYIVKQNTERRETYVSSCVRSC